MKPFRHPAPSRAARPRQSFRRAFCFVVLAAGCLVSRGLRAEAAPVSIAGVYECEGTVVQTASGYAGPVSLRALLALDFDLPQGSLRHPDITAVEIEQEERHLRIRTRNAGGIVEWSADWSRNGGFEATKDGVKFLLRAKAAGTDGLFMFTLSPVKDGAAMLAKVEQIQTAKLGPAAKEIGSFLFLRAPPR